MNKETRSFIWGLILLLICGLALTLQLIDIKQNGIADRSIYSYIQLGLNIYGTYSGIRRIYDTI